MRDTKIKMGAERSPEAVAFLQDLVEVCRKHGFVLRHYQDSVTAFFVERRDAASVDSESADDFLAEAYEEVSP